MPKEVNESLIKRGEYRIIRVDGTETMHDERPRMANLHRLLGCEMVDTVIIDWANKQIMVVDDTGMCDGKPVNGKATKLYRAICKPGTLGFIHGDVAIVHDGDSIAMFRS